MNERSEDANDTRPIQLGAREEEREHPLPKRIGPYRILKVLGEGGMGIVYLAEQDEPIRRKVALKVIKLGMDTSEVVARFETERQALALMDHSSVAKVFDGGADQGRPYFVMELVDGVPITEYSRHQKLSLDDRLELFIQVCAALEHAHQKGVIHRDVKPSNVLVATQDGLPVAKVIDFGIAKATSEGLTGQTVHTKFGQAVGTPEYMSPEQVGGAGIDVDTRTDVYALGVLLYELLTGSVPFNPVALRGVGLTELQRIIREVEPVKPSTRASKLGTRDGEKRGSAETAALCRRLRGELDWIVMRALEKDRSRRYGSARELGQDIQRFLDDEPVLANPPSAAYRASKFVKRNRIAVLFASTILVFLVAGIVGTSLGMLRARRAEDAAQQARDEAISARDDAEQARREETRQRLAALKNEEQALRQARIADAVNSFLNEDLLAAADPRNTADRDLRVRDVLAAASEGIASRFGGEPLVAASIRSTLGRTYSSLGLYEEAQPHLRVAYDLRVAELGEGDPETSEAQAALGENAYYRGRFGEAEELYSAALDSMEAELGLEAHSTLAVLSGLALLYSDQGRYDEAEPLMLEGLATARRVLGENHDETLTFMNSLAMVYGDQRRFGEADEQIELAVDLLLDEKGEEHPHTLSALSNLGWLRYLEGRAAEAEEIQVATLKSRRRILGDEHLDTLTSMNNLAVLYNSVGRYEEAEPLYLEDLDTSRRVLGEGHPYALVSMSNLSRFYWGQRRFEEAASILKRSVELHRTAQPAAYFGTGLTLQNYGETLFELGRYSAAETALLEAREILKMHFKEDELQRVMLRKALVDTYEALGKAEEADKWRSQTN